MRLIDFKGPKDSFIIEAVYPGNVGAMEVFQFFRKASDEQKVEFDQLLARKEYDEAWELVQKVTGVRLDTMKKP